MVQLPWPTDPEQEHRPQSSMGEVPEHTQVERVRIGRHRAPSVHTSSAPMTEVGINLGEELYNIETAWSERDAEYLYLIWLGSRGRTLDEHFPSLKFRQMARDRLAMIGEKQRVAAIERALQNAAPAVGRVSLRTVQLKSALTEPIGEYPRVQQEN